MSSWFRVVILFVCTLILFLGIDTFVADAETKDRIFSPRCETVDEQMKNDIEVVLEILQAEDYDKLTDRVNNLLASTELLEEERNLMEVAGCLEEVPLWKELHHKVNGYHSLLFFAIQMKKEKDIQFEEITFELADKYILQYVEGTLTGDDGQVFIQHDLSLNPGIEIRSREIHLMERRENELEEYESSAPLKITGTIASSAYAFIQNPIEKFMDSVDRYHIGKDEKEEEYFVNGARLNAGKHKMGLSIITYEKSNWETMNLVQYYPLSITYDMLDRAAQVHEEFPDYWYPKDLIEQGHWNGIVAYYKKNKVDMIGENHKLYHYIMSEELLWNESFEELVEEVKREGE